MLKHMRSVVCVCVCCLQKTEVFSVRRTDEARIMLTFTYTNEIPPSAPNCLQLYNIIFKRLTVNNNDDSSITSSSRGRPLIIMTIALLAL